MLEYSNPDAIKNKSLAPITCVTGYREPCRKATGSPRFIDAFGTPYFDAFVQTEPTTNDSTVKSSLHCSAPGHRNRPAPRGKCDSAVLCPKTLEQSTSSGKVPKHRQIGWGLPDKVIE